MDPALPPIERHVISDAVVVGVSDDALTEVPGEFDVLLTSRPDPPRPWVNAPLDEVVSAVDAAPLAATVLVQVLRAIEPLPVASALTVESMGYSLLQCGEGFRRWSADRPRQPRPQPTGEVVLLERHDDRLDIVLNRPEVHNALNAAMRDALVEAFDLVALDSSITEVHLSGAGRSFCSGGDLDEFGLAGDVGAAHLLRIAQSVGRRIHESSDRVRAHIHGSCIGAGIEMSAFAGWVTAHPESRIRLPELSMGLIPGAGGTVSVSRRMGRQRTAWFALTGSVLDAGTAQRWGLVDSVETGSA